MPLIFTQQRFPGAGISQDYEHNPGTLDKIAEIITYYNENIGNLEISPKMMPGQV